MNLAELYAGVRTLTCGGLTQLGVSFIRVLQASTDPGIARAEPSRHRGRMSRGRKTCASCERQSSKRAEQFPLIASSGSRSREHTLLPGSAFQNVSEKVRATL